LFVTISEFAGIAAAGELFNLNKYILVPLVAFFIWFSIVKLNYTLLEKFFFVIILFYFAYIASGFMVKPQWGHVLKQLAVPQIQFSKDYLFLLIALIGTTITPWMQFYLQSSIVEKGIRKEEDNLYVFSPLVLPFPYLWAARWVNKRMILSILNRWIKVMDFSDPIIFACRF